MKIKQIAIAFGVALLSFSLASCGDATVNLESINVSSDSKVNYTVNEDFTKPIVFASYKDKTTKDVSNDCDYAGFTTATEGSKTINVYYTEENVTKKTSYTITVAKSPLSKIEVESFKAVYSIGDEFVKPVVKATFVNGTTSDVSSKCTFTGFDSSTEGEETISVSYTYDGVTKTTSYNVTIVAPDIDLAKIDVTSYKDKYNIGDKFVKPTVTALFTDGTELDVTNEAVFKGFDSETAGTKLITVSYTFQSTIKTKMFNVEVKEITSLLRYAIFADVQLCAEGIKDGGSTANVNLGETANAPLALKNHLEFCKKEGINTILMNGDITNQANEYYYQFFEKIVKGVYGDNKDEWPEFVWNMGNHEWWWGTSEKETGDAVSMFRKYARIDSENLVEESNVSYSINPAVKVPSYYKVINGVPFIVISAESSAGNVGASLKAEIIEWLDQAKQLETVQAGGPIFVEYHYPLTTSMTHGQAAAATCTTVEDIFKDTPNAVIFTGDTHFPGNSERSINQVNFTTINLGTSSYSRMVNTGATKMYEFDNVQGTGAKVADKMIGNVKYNSAYTPTIQVVDVKSNSSYTIDRYFSEENGNARKVGPTWEFDPILSKDDFTYTNDRFKNVNSSLELYGKEGLNWKETDKVTVGIKGSQMTVLFPDVIDYQYCEHYVIDVNGKMYDVVSNYYKSLETSEENYYILEDIPVTENYIVKVTAYDFYDNPSTDYLITDVSNPNATIDAVDYQSTFTYCDIQTRNRFDEVSPFVDTKLNNSHSSVEFSYQGIQTYKYGAIANRIYSREANEVSCKDYLSITDEATSPTVRVDVKNLGSDDLIVGLTVKRWNGSSEEWKSDFGGDTQNIIKGNAWQTLYWDLTDFDIKTKNEIAGIYLKVKSAGASSDGYKMDLLIDNIDIINEYPLPKHRGSELTAGVEFSKVFSPSIDKDSGTFVFDILFTSDESTYIDFILFYTNDWSRYFGYYKVKGDGTLGDTYNGVAITELPDGYYRVTMNLAEVTKFDGGNRPNVDVNHFWIRTSTSTASGYIELNPSIE